MNVQEVADRVIELVGDRAEAQVAVDGTEHALTRFANSFIHQNVGESGLEVMLKVAVNDRVASATTSRSDDAGLAALVEEAIHAARLRPTDKDWPGLAEPAALVAPARFDEATATADPNLRAAEVEAFIKAGGGLLGAGYFDTQGGPTAFANSAGQRLITHHSRATLDGIHQTGTSAGSAHATGASVSAVDGAALGARAAATARDSAGTLDVEPGAYEVVLSPECVSTIMFFLAAYGWNAKAHQEGQSFAELGEQQFDPAVTIEDDYADDLAVGLPFDVDGTPKRRITMVGAGVSEALAHDRRTAKRVGTDSTGHAIPGGDSFGAFPTNLHFRPGTADPTDMIASVQRGLLVTTFNYCRILDPRTQVVTGLTRNGTFLIENGEIAGAVSNLRFTQSFVEGLSSGRVLGVGNDARMADSEAGPGMTSAPTVHLSEWNFTGGAQG
ncbi:MAG: TldD/PmbA family protein [Acidimicrobiia bacterium]|nr:TldD/PmbA family protein [Acidimicrobiia bacterium]